MYHDPHVSSSTTCLPSSTTPTTTYSMQIAKMSSPTHSSHSYLDTLLHKDIPPLHENTLYSADSQPKASTMPGSNRSPGRNVHIFDSQDPNTTIGGLILTDSVTNTNLYTMIEIIVIFEGEFSLQNEGGIILVKNNDQLQPGNYYIHSTRKFLYNKAFMDK